MPTRARSSCARVVLILAVTFVCLGLTGAAAVALYLPGAAAELGPASPSIPPMERALVSSYLLLRLDALNSPAGHPSASVELQVDPGVAASAVAVQLSEAGVLADQGLFLQYLRYRGLDRSIEAGRYLITGDMTIPEIASRLQSADGVSMRLTIPEGWRREQIADLLHSSDLPITRAEFLRATASRPTGFAFNEALPPGASLEGFLFPDTYLVDPETSSAQLVLAMLDVFELRVSPGLREGFTRQGLDLFQAVTLASIIEREAVVAGERALIASVFLNRLQAGIKLEADPTVQYALGLTQDGGWWKSPLSLEDLRVQSPYNTYQVTGLPPGPIANPGLASLQAVAEPADTEFLYFQAACDGSGRHQFAVTFEEHLANSCP